MWLAFLWSVLLSAWTSKWNLKKSDIIVKLLSKSVYTKPNLCLSATKLLKLVYAPLNVTLFIFFSTNLNIEKRKEVIFFSFKRKFNIFVSFVYVLNKSWNLFRFFKQRRIFYNMLVWKISVCFLGTLDLMESPWLLHQFHCNTFDQIK